MRLPGRNLLSILGILMIVAALSSCATIHDIKMTYRLPPGTDELRGKSVFLDFKDMRENKSILVGGALDDFRNFSGNISFYLARDQEKGFLMGLLDLRSIFIEAFDRRLGDLGVTVVSERDKSDIELVIALTEFSLDLTDRKWTARMSYEARAEKSGKTLSRQTIQGEAERLKLFGQDQADVVMSDVFTDSVNELDVPKLFGEAAGRD